VARGHLKGTISLTGAKLLLTIVNGSGAGGQGATRRIQTYFWIMVGTHYKKRLVQTVDPHLGQDFSR
jgi:hypothetical protein